MADILELLRQDSPAEEGNRPVRIVTVFSLERKVRDLFSAQIFDMILLSVNRNIIRDIRRAMGLAEDLPQSEKIIEQSLEDLFQRGWLTGKEQLTITTSGRKHLDKWM